MESTLSFRVNSPDVIQETIDGEVIIVNLGDGSYYSIDQVGADIWSLIEKGHTVDQIVGAINRAYVGSHEEVAQGVEQLVTQLQQEKLIVPSGAPQSNGQAELKPSLGQDDPNKTTFAEPELHKYTDMEDLLLLDPIHDVDEMGWPYVPEDA